MPKVDKFSDRQKLQKEHELSYLSNFLSVSHNGCDDPEKLLALADDIGSFRGARSERLAQEAKIDVASRFFHEIGDKALLLLAEAGAQLDKVAKNSLSFEGFKAYHVAMDIPVRALVLQSELPDSQLLEKNYHRNIGMAYEMLGKLQDKREARYGTDRASARGFLGELAIHALLRRYTIQDIGSSYIALGSTLTEDYGRVDGTSTYHGWDCSIYSNLTGEFDLIDKLQVKLKNGTDDAKNYHDDISVVYVGDIRPFVAGRGHTIPQNIIGELHREHDPDNTPRQKFNLATRLDERLGSLLSQYEVCAI